MLGFDRELRPDGGLIRSELLSIVECPASKVEIGNNPSGSKEIEIVGISCLIRRNIQLLTKVVFPAPWIPFSPRKNGGASLPSFW